VPFLPFPTFIGFDLALAFRRELDFGARLAGLLSRDAPFAFMMTVPL
jgi:hypothetical protein